jgi:hypothetical protein
MRFAKEPVFSGRQEKLTNNNEHANANVVDLGLVKVYPRVERSRTKGSSVESGDDSSLPLIRIVTRYVVVVFVVFLSQLLLFFVSPTQTALGSVE